jgi:hypothetical protein
MYTKVSAKTGRCGANSDFQLSSRRLVECSRKSYTYKERNSDAVDKVDLQQNTAKVRPVFVSCHQNAGHNHLTRTANKFFGKLVKVHVFRDGCYTDRT